MQWRYSDMQPQESTFSKAFLRKLLQDTWHQNEDINQERILNLEHRVQLKREIRNLQHDIDEGSQHDHCAVGLESNHVRLEYSRRLS